MPADLFFSQETGLFKPNDELKEIFTSRDIDFGKQTVFSCNSGVTACIVDLAWNIVGGRKAAVYNGSWLEYSRQKEPDFSKINYD